jgi:hypothetical protein
MNCPKCGFKLKNGRLILLPTIDEIIEYKCSKCRDRVFLYFYKAQSYTPQRKIWFYFENAKQVFYKSEWISLEEINCLPNVERKALFALQKYLQIYEDNYTRDIKVVCPEVSFNNSLIKYLYADMWANCWHFFADFLPLLHKSLNDEVNNREKIIMAPRLQFRLLKLMFPSFENWVILNEYFLSPVTNPEDRFRYYFSFSNLLSKLGNNIRLVHSPIRMEEGIGIWNSLLKERLSRILESTPEYERLTFLKERYHPIIFLNIRFRTSRYWFPRSNVYYFYKMLKNKYPEGCLILCGMPTTCDSQNSSYIEDNSLDKFKKDDDCYFYFDKDLIEQLAAAKISDICIFPHGGAQGLGIFQDKDMIVLSIEERRSEDMLMSRYISRHVRYTILYSEFLEKSLRCIRRPINNPIKVEPELVLEKVNEVLAK